MKIHTNTHYINTYPDGESIVMVKKLAIPHPKSKIINVNLNKNDSFSKVSKPHSQGCQDLYPEDRTC